MSADVDKLLVRLVEEGRPLTMGKEVIAMATGTMTSKGQITIPAEVRRSLGLRAGSRVTFVQREDGVVELRREIGSVRSLRGIVTPPPHPVSIEDMDEAVYAGVVEENSASDA